MTLKLYYHNWDKCRSVKCKNCGQPIQFIFDPKIRNICDDCGGVGKDTDFKLILGGLKEKK